MAVARTAVRLLRMVAAALPPDARCRRMVGARAAQCRPTVAVAVERRPMAEGADPPVEAAEVVGLREVLAGAADTPLRRATARAGVGEAHTTATVTDLNY